MYQAGRRIISHHKRHVFLGWFTFFIMLLIIGGYLFAKFFLKSNTNIAPPPPAKISTVSDNSGKNKLFDEPGFTIKLPVDWKWVGHTDAPYNAYTWKNTTKDPGPGVQQLQIYVEDIPVDRGVNRVLPVQGNGSKIVPTSVQDDNCYKYINARVPGSPSTPAKWSGVSFLCDMGNYERDVVGTSSSDGINTVKVTGQKTGTHRIFFAYTDNSPAPNYTIFTDAVASYQQK